MLLAVKPKGAMNQRMCNKEQFAFLHILLTGASILKYLYVIRVIIV